jgi:hypothetical protein
MFSSLAIKNQLFLLPKMCAMCPAHLIVLSVIILKHVTKNTNYEGPPYSAFSVLTFLFSSKS